MCFFTEDTPLVAGRYQVCSCGKHLWPVFYPNQSRQTKALWIDDDTRITDAHSGERILYSYVLARERLKMARWRLFWFSVFMGCFLYLVVEVHTNHLLHRPAV